MRPAALAAFALATQPAAAQVLPPQPWSHVRHVTLGGTCVGPLVPRPGGGAAVQLGPASGIALLGRDGSVEQTFRTEIRAADALWWVGREALHGVHGRELMAYGVDGTLRGVVTLPEVPVGYAVRGDARESVVAFTGASGLLAARYAWDAAPVASEPASGWRPTSSQPVTDGLGGVWVAAGAGLVRLSPAAARVPLLRGVRRLAPRGRSGLFALAEGALLAVDARGNLLGRSVIDATVVDIAARDDGGAALLLQSSPPRVLVVDPVAAPRASFAAPPDARSLTTAADGALLVAARDGTLAAHESDGAPRWTLRLPGPVRPPVVALTSERFAVATERDEVIVLELAEPPPAR